MANGQFILLRREAWEPAGGFPAVRAAPLDDVAIARRLRETGGRTAFFRAPDLLRVRMYRGAREAVRGWRRNLGGLFGDRPGTVAVILAVLLRPPLVLAAELLAPATGWPPPCSGPPAPPPRPCCAPAAATLRPGASSIPATPCSSPPCSS